jgi:uncharacterized protein YbjT (DUF2867 family)
MRILVTGSNGFVGKNLSQKLVEQGHEVYTLKRNPSEELPGQKTIIGDLLKPSSLKDLGSFDCAYYLVHSMKGDESRFEYEESLSAVNFLHWIKNSNARVIYLGGLGPVSQHLSAHLRSRHLTGAILGAGPLPVLEMRASIILGEGSLSFEMIKALAERMPFRPEMSILNQACQPLALVDLIDYLVAGLTHTFSGHKILEIAGPDTATYGELLDLYANLTGLKRKKIKFPQVENKVLLKVLEYAVPEHSQIAKKLAQSLEYPTVQNSKEALELFPNITPRSLELSMQEACVRSTSEYAPLWGKDFLKTLLSDKLLTESGLLSPEMLKNLDKVSRIKNFFSRK